MLQYLEEQYGERATKGDKHNLEFMRNEAKRLQAQYDEVLENEKHANAGQDEQKSARNSESDTDEDVSIIELILCIEVNIECISCSYRKMMIMLTFYRKN